MNYEMPTHSPPVILKRSAMKRWTGGGGTLPVEPSSRPEAGAAGTHAGKTGLPDPSGQPGNRGLAVEETGQEAKQRTGRMPWRR